MDVVIWPIDANKLSPLPFWDQSITKSAIGPGEHMFKFETLKDDRLLETLESDGLRDGKIAIVVHGEIRYRDVLAKDSGANTAISLAAP